MRPHHFVLILVCIATYLLVFESTLSLSPFRKHQETKPDSSLSMPWGGSS
jgi:hypothetical protein